MKEFADVLIEYMKKTGDTQYGINKKTGVSLSTINDIVLKKKSPTQKTMKKICDGLEIGLNEFDDEPILKRAYDLADTMNLDDKRKEALEKIKALPVDEQQERLNRSIEKLKSLPPESRKAAELFIEFLSSPPRQ